MRTCSCTTNACTKATLYSNDRARAPPAQYGLASCEIPHNLKSTRRKVFYVVQVLDSTPDFMKSCAGVRLEFGIISLTCLSAVESSREQDLLSVAGLV